MEPNTYDVHVVRGKSRALTKQMMFQAEALRAGLRTIRTESVSFLADAGEGTPTIGFRSARTSRQELSAHLLTKDKARARLLLEERGLPVAPGRAFPPSSRHEAKAYGQLLGFPLVVKPVGGTKGIAVSANIKSDDALERGIDAVLSSQFCSSGILIERHVKGGDYRFLATSERVISVIKRTPAAVTGDGVHTVAQLVDNKNKARRLNPYLRANPIVLNEVATELLAADGLRPESVPDAGRLLVLATVANLSRGGDSTEVRHQTHPSLLDLATSAVRATRGLDYAGVDILAEDHTQAMGDQSVHLIEINGNPAIMMHPFPMHGRPVNAVRELVREVAAEAGLPTRPPAEEIEVEASIAGRVQGVGYRKWARRRIVAFELQGQVRSGGTSPGHVEAILLGNAERVCMLLRSMLRGPAAAEVDQIVVHRTD